MSNVLITLVAMAFAGMGVAGLLFPTWTIGLFGTRELTLDGRNEVRAVYGGFGLAVAALLVYGALEATPDVRAGILLAFVVSLAGMVAGRLISLAFERRIGRFPAFVLVCEAGLATCLYLAYAT